MILIFEKKNKFVVWSIARKEEAKSVMFLSKKDMSKVKNTILRWILRNIWQNQTFQRIIKSIMVYFNEMNFMKGIFILVKVDEMYNILKSASHCLLVERWRWNWMIKIFAGICLWMSMRLLRPSFIKGQASFSQKYSFRERVWYYNIDDTVACQFRDPKNRTGRKNNF